MLWAPKQSIERQEHKGCIVLTFFHDTLILLACSGLCSQTFYGHMNSCNAGVFNLMGNTLASTDADGVLKLWDTRMVGDENLCSAWTFRGAHETFPRVNVEMGIGLHPDAVAIPILVQAHALRILARWEECFAYQGSQPCNGSVAVHLLCEGPCTATHPMFMHPLLLACECTSKKTGEYKWPDWGRDSTKDHAHMAQEHARMLIPIMLRQLWGSLTMTWHPSCSCLKRETHYY
eukprot:1158146-Pelagomonas_calceolata.AAC.6